MIWASCSVGSGRYQNTLQIDLFLEPGDVGLSDYAHNACWTRSGELLRISLGKGVQTAACSERLAPGSSLRSEPGLERAKDDLTCVPDDRGLHTVAAGEVGFEIGDC